MENVKIARSILTRKSSINTKSMEQMYMDHLRMRSLLQKVKMKSRHSASLAPANFTESQLNIRKDDMSKVSYNWRNGVLSSIKPNVDSKSSKKFIIQKRLHKLVANGC
eukprot:TRINITY_DN10244_c0_g3_i1.p2 TRINITY_DN10244_c0_g3~~TRINITY_DN10244_c0_g3_i1.p2  ORF type:complete len:108 (+),score=17.68 TRINITY_DN10244_c0_g3_i1:552-875(+)